MNIFAVFFLALIVFNLRAWADFPDPEDELRRLSTAEYGLVSSACLPFDMSIPEYRACVWGELASVGVYP